LKSTGAVARIGRLAMRYPPPIVAQVDPKRLFGKRVVRLPVATVPWKPEQERTTIVVKASYRFDREAKRPTLELLSEQPGFDVGTARDEPGAEPIERTSADDLVAIKRDTDLLLYGHAHGHVPSERINAHVCIQNKFDLRFCAVGTKNDSHPLTAGYLRDTDGETRIPPVGAIAPRVVESAEIKALEEMTDEERAAACHTLLEQVYGGEYRPWEGMEGLEPQFQVEEELEEDDAVQELRRIPAQDDDEVWEDLAPADEPLLDGAVQFGAAHSTAELLEEDDLIVLEGLFPGGDGRRLKLPGHIVLAVFEARDQIFDVGMMMDTIRIDTDAGTLSMVWRGQVPADAFAYDEQRLIVTLAPFDDEPLLSEVYRELPRGTFYRATIPEGSDVPDPEPYVDDIDLQVARQQTMNRVPEPLLGLDAFAELAGAIATTPDHKARLLAAQGFDDIDWMLEERAWRGRVGRALADGNLELVSAFNHVLKEAREAARAASASEERQ
jgi:Uncharacterized protein conserved in bacteria (DUF2169)